MVVHQRWHKAEKPLREHVAAIRRVDLAVDRERRDAREAPDADRRRCSFPVVLEQTGFERRVRVAFFQIRRVLVGAAGEQFAVPRRQRQHHDAESRRQHRTQRNAPRIAAGLHDRQAGAR